MDIEVQKDGIVGAWHRWVVIMTASTVLFGYIGFALLNLFIRVSGLSKLLNITLPYPLDWHLLLVLIPAGIIRGEMGYQRDLEVNGPKKVLLDKPGGQ